jgi:tetratricopeptide (TPR) repeat protein
MPKIKSVSLSLALGLFLGLGPCLADGFYMWNGKRVSKEFAQSLTLINKANTNITNGKIDEACSQAEEACQLAPENALCHAAFGNALARAGKNEQSIEECRKAIALDSTSPESWITLGAVLQSSGHSAEAIDTLHQYLERFPSDSRVTMIKNELVMLEAESKRRLPQAQESADDYFADTTATAGTLKWEARFMPLKVLIESGDGILAYKSEYGPIVHDAFLQWEKISNGKINFVFLDPASTQRPDIRVTWRTDSKELSQAAEGGEAEVRPGSDGISDVLIKLLTISPLKSMPMNDGMMKFTATHEIGHSLGLMGHSPVAGDIMYASIPLNFEHVAISSRDAKTLTKLYSDDVRCSTVNDVAKSLGVAPNLAPGQILSDHQEFEIDAEAKKIAATGDFVQAAEKYRQGLVRFPSSVLLKHNYLSAISNCGKQQMDQKNYEKAAEYYKSGLAIDPNNQILVMNYGVNELNWANQFARERNYQRAEALYIEALRALKFNNQRPELISLATQNYAIVLRNMGRDTEAVKLEAQALR